MENALLESPKNTIVKKWVTKSGLKARIEFGDYNHEKGVYIAFVQDPDSTMKWMEFTCGVPFEDIRTLSKGSTRNVSSAESACEQLAEQLVKYVKV